MTLGTEVGLSSGDFVLDGDPAPFPKRDGAPPQFLVYFYCGQTAGCIQMPLGMEVGVRPGDFVLHGDQIVPPQIGGGAPSPIFGPCLLRSNGCIDQDATWYGWRFRPTRHCVRRRPSSPPLRCTAPNFRPMSVVAKRLDGSRCHLVRRLTSAQATLC